MDIESFFGKLAEKELFSSKRQGGKYILEVGALITKPLSASPEPILKSNLIFSPKLKEVLIDLYTQVGEITLYWDVKQEDMSKINENEWFRSNYPPEEYDYKGSYLRETVSGTINIVNSETLHNEKFEWKGNWYYPFDRHYNVIAYFKLEDGIIEDNIYLFNVGGKTMDNMKVTCMEYLQLAYEAKLFYYWQYAYLFKDGDHNQRLHKVLPEILEFVELDLSKFK